MQHIHVDHALVTQALEHLTLVTNDRQPKRSHLALQRYGLQLLGGEIGIILQKPAGLNAGIMLEIQFVANIRQRLWADIILGGKILQGIIGLLIHGTHRVEGFLMLGVVGGNLRPPNNRRQRQALHQHRHHDHGGHHENNEIPVRHRCAHRQCHRQGHATAQASHGAHHPVAVNLAPHLRVPHRSPDQSTQFMPFTQRTLLLCLLGPVLFLGASLNVRQHGRPHKQEPHQQADQPYCCYHDGRV